MTWAVIDNRDENGQIHTIPLWERDKHSLTLQCDCLPRIEVKNNGDVVIHNEFEPKKSNRCCG